MDLLLLYYLIEVLLLLLFHISYAMDPFSFQNLLNGQQVNNSFSFLHPKPSVDLTSSDAFVFCTEDVNEEEHTGSQRQAKWKWSITEDTVLITAWLNISKDDVVNNGQKADAFWKRIATYVTSSPKLEGLQKRVSTNCKQRWGKINEGVCNFVGYYEAATKQKSSGQTEDDMLKMANEIYYNDNKVRFTLEYVWLKLCHDKKWC